MIDLAVTTEPLTDCATFALSPMRCIYINIGSSRCSSASKKPPLPAFTSSERTESLVVSFFSPENPRPGPFFGLFHSCSPPSLPRSASLKRPRSFPWTGSA
ncbi:hypothetical protein RB195_007982 [Necator americanus]|uniref:Uncharacterized protein n=1 Tax=Necator americanus TaxID=51031 RepID=A0ABR1C371_NECAM